MDATTPGHYFDPSPSARSRPRRVNLTLPDGRIELTTDAGVFSSDRVDTGTKYLLLEGPPPPPEGHLLDLGCGYGPIAITLARRSPDATVWAVDVNRRAVERCVANAAEAGTANVRALVAADPATAVAAGLPAEVRFAGIWSNPPIRIGKAALHELLTGWLGRLAPGGRAHLVVQKHLGSDSLARWLGEQGWTVTRRGSRAGYRLLDVGPGADTSTGATDPAGGDA